MEVFGDDFAAVYFREKLCYDDLTEYGTISGEIWKTFIGRYFVAFAHGLVTYVFVRSLRRVRRLRVSAATVSQK